MRGSIRTKIIRQTVKSTFLAGIALGLLPFVGNNALAQGNAILEEIIVTATKREESLQDVPISVATARIVLRPGDRRMRCPAEFIEKLKAKESKK